MLRDSFALTLTGHPRPFAEVAGGVLEGLLTEAGSEPAPGIDPVGHLLESFSALPLHDDVGPGVELLTRAGWRLATLSNGSVEVAEALLARARLRRHFERLMSVAAAGAWKPHGGAYRYAASELGCEPGSLLLVAVHPWDIDGAARAGLRTAWLNRRGLPWPPAMTRADVEIRRLEELPASLS